MDAIWSARGFYTRKEAALIARIPASTATHWDKRGIVIPDLEWTDEDGQKVIGYSFGGVIYLRLIKMLRDKGFPLRKAVNATQHLTNVFGPPGPNWQNARLFTFGADLWVDHKDNWEVTAATRRGQKGAVILFGKEFSELRKRADALLVPDEFAAYVEIDPDLRNGLPVLKRTGIKTSTIHALHNQGLTYKQIREYYPDLTMKQIIASNRFERFLEDRIAA